jgi:serine/alanine adding enzyme
MTKIILLTDQHNSKWDEYVMQCPEGTFFHLTGWKNVIEKSLRLTPIYIMALNEADKIRGVLPMFLMRDILTRKYLVSLPFSAHAGICADDMDIRTELLKKANEIAVENRVQYIELRQLADEVFQLPTQKDFVTMIVKLEKGEEFLWNHSFNKRRRTAVRKAQKEGLTVDFKKNHLAEFYNILSINQRNLGTPNYPKLFLRNFLEEFNDSANIIVVKYRDKIIGGTLFVTYKNMLIPFWAASLSQYNNLRPNDMLYWEAMKFACRNGFKYFDFGRSTINSGTFKFKQNWGAETVHLNYQYLFNKCQRIPTVSATADNKYQLAINIWKKLPMAVVNTLGPKLIRYLPEL